MQYARDAYDRLAACHAGGERYDCFLSFVVSYCRPFTENSGLGNLGLEFPNYPEELPLSDAKVRHSRMMDLRNKFLSHSSLEGTKVVLLSSGAVDPGTGNTVKSYSWNIAKREFLDQRYADWLVQIVDSLSEKLTDLIESETTRLSERFLGIGEVREIPTPADDFTWS
jgi:hypothetical protein